MTYRTPALHPDSLGGSIEAAARMYGIDNIVLVAPKGFTILHQNGFPIKIVWREYMPANTAAIVEYTTLARWDTAGAA